GQRSRGSVDARAAAARRRGARNASAHVPRARGAADAPGSRAGARAEGAETVRQPARGCRKGPGAPGLDAAGPGRRSVARDRTTFPARAEASERSAGTDMTSPMPVVVVCAVAALLGWLAVGAVIRRSSALGLLDRPGHRSSHEVVTPTGGGIGIVAVGTLAGCLALANGSWNAGWAALALALLVAAFSLRDDARPLGAGMRLAVQSVAVAGLLAAAAAGPSMLPFAPVVGFGVAFALLLVGGLWWINLFNFMDGIDGLAASEALFLLIAGAVLASRGDGVGESPVALWMLCVAAATAGFLVHNWAPARIFMGDVGSTYLAYMILAFALWSVLDG